MVTEALHITHNGTGKLLEVPCYIVEIDLNTRKVCYTREDKILDVDSMNNFKLPEIKIKDNENGKEVKTNG
jgi:hypothetical protein